MDFEVKIQPVNLVILFTNARDEKHIREWALHHLNIGFDLIVIFDHMSVEPIQNIVSDMPKVVVEPCVLTCPPKIPLMKLAHQIASHLKADWFIYLDADEFLYISTYPSVKDLLFKYNFADSLGINWVLYGSSYHKSDPGSIREYYTRSQKKLNKHVKSFTRPDQVIDVDNPHFYIVANTNRIYGINKQMPQGPFNEWDIEFDKCPAFIAHYEYQSEETYHRRKVALPRDDTGEYRETVPDLHSLYNDVENTLLAQVASAQKK